jgi:hypothetical protein
MRLFVLITLMSFAAEVPAAEIAHAKADDVRASVSIPVLPPAGTNILPRPPAESTRLVEIILSGSAHRTPVTSSSILVETTAQPLSPTSQRVTADAIETAAGAFEDPSRYFQLLPGVVSDSDQRNDFLVRGGNPAENLFVIDNIDIHSINHLAMADTTGGFVSMIDNAAIQSMTLHTAAHDAKFDDRLSSVVEISTIPDNAPGARSPIRHMTEAGIAGVGGMTSRPLGENGSVFLSGREGILNLVTNDIGLNGVPHYSNYLLRADNTLANGDRIWGLSLTGIDSIKIHPSQYDTAETNPYDINYSGWRDTTGINWQHLFNQRSYSVLTLSNSEQAQTTNQFAQLNAEQNIYSEQTHDSDTTFKSEYTLQAASRLILSGGLNETLTRLNYSIVQPAGVLANPYITNTASTTATSIHRNFATADDGGYGQAVLTLPGDLHLTVAAREHRWAFGNHFALTPKTSLSAPLGGTRVLSVGLADYAQMPPFLYMLAFQQNSALAPIRSRHLTAAITLVDHSRFRMALAAYRKTYRDYPVSTQFPQLSLANIVDTFGQAFLMFPMVSKGFGKAAGAEFQIDLRPTSRLMLTGNVAYSRSWYSGLDGVLRKGSFDIPIVANVAAVFRAGHGVTASFRYSGTSGRPYTPDDLPLSYAQNRDVYDLSQVNALRSSMYGRLDFRIEKASNFHNGVLLWHAGLDNALNRNNFYSYQWQPFVGGVAQQSQMPRFPDAGAKFTF